MWVTRPTRLLRFNGRTGSPRPGGHNALQTLGSLHEILRITRKPTPLTGRLPRCPQIIGWSDVTVIYGHDTISTGSVVWIESQTVRHSRRRFRIVQISIILLEIVINWHKFINLYKIYRDLGKSQMILRRSILCLAISQLIYCITRHSKHSSFQFYRYTLTSVWRIVAPQWISKHNLTVACP